MNVARIIELVNDLDETMAQAYEAERSRFRSVQLTRSRMLAAQLREELTAPAEN